MKYTKLLISMLLTLIVFAGCASYGKLSRITENNEDMAQFFSGKDIPVARGSEQGIHFDGKQWYYRSLELINQAEDYIFVNSFLTTEHPNALAVLDALRRKMDEGVRVYCIFDSASYYRVYPHTSDPITAAIMYADKIGLNYTEYNPIRGRRVLTLAKLFDRDHRKFWIVDGKVAVSGGQNIDYDSLSFPEDGGCIDTMVEVESKELVSALSSTFIDSWNSYSVDKLRKEDFTVRAAETGYPFWYFDQAPGTGGQVTAMFDGFFSFAEESIWMVQCYTYVTPSLLDKVRFAVDRGIDVNFIISENQIGNRFEKASLYSIKPLIEAGAKVYLFDSPTGSLLHYKLILADDKIASIGSANYNLRSQTLSRELSVVLIEPSSIKKVSDNLDELFKHCRRVFIDDTKAYQGLEYLANYILMQFWG